jgi:hemerythrin-like domain-containing protein
MTKTRHAAGRMKSSANFDDPSYHYSSQGRSNPDGGPSNALHTIVETLNSEHRYLLHLLNDLELEVGKLVPGRRADYALLLDMVDYLAQYPDQYHHPREDILFTALLGEDPHFSGKLDQLLQDHHYLHEYNDQLLHELTRVVGGKRANRQSLKQIFEDYLANYREHMQFESREIFPLASGKLSDDVLMEISEKTRYIDDPLFGRDVHDRYQHIRRSLQVRLDNMAEDIVESELALIKSGVEHVEEIVGTVGDLGLVVGKLVRDGFEEQLETVKQHIRPGDGPSVVSLPWAMIKNYGRQITRGVREVREALEQNPKN